MYCKTVYMYIKIYVEVLMRAAAQPCQLLAEKVKRAINLLYMSHPLPNDTLV